MDWFGLVSRELMPVVGLFILLVFLFNNKIMRYEDKRWFYVSIGLEFLDIVSYEFSIWSTTLIYPTLMHTLATVFGYILRPAIIIAIIYLTVGRTKRKTDNAILFIPFIINAVIAISGLFSKIAFWYDETNTYNRGPLGFTAYVISAYYIMLLLVLNINNTNKRTSAERAIIIIDVVFIVVATIIQYFAGDISWVLRTAMVASTFFYFFLIQNKLMVTAVDTARLQEEEISLSMSQMGKMVCLYDVATRILTMPDEYRKIVGAKSNTVVLPDDVLKKGIIDKETADNCLSFFEKILKGEKKGETYVHMVSPQNKARWEHAEFINIFDNQGKPLRAIIATEDVTEAYENIRTLEHYRNTLDNIVGDEKLYIEYDLTNKTVLTIEGNLIPIPEKISEMKLSKIMQYITSNHARPEDVKYIRGFADSEKLLAEYKIGNKHHEIERIMVFPDKSECWVKMTVDIAPAEDNNQIVALVLWENVDAAHREQADLLNRANTDILTGLLNRNATMKEIEDYLISDGKSGTHALIMMDLDNLKDINDILGHQQGDKALSALAKEMQNFFDQDDIVGRIGGDEFFAFAKNISAESISSKMQELLHNLEISYSDGEKQVVTSASAGISMYHGDVDPRKTLSELYNEADTALYNSKAKGKNSFSFSDDLDTLAASSTTIPKSSAISHSLRGLLNNIASGIAIYNCKSEEDIIPTFCNDKFLNILGITKEKFFAQKVKANSYGIYPEDRKLVAQTFKEAITTLKSVQCTFRVFKPNDCLRLVTAFANAHRVQDGSYDVYVIYSDESETEYLNNLREDCYRQFKQKWLATTKNEFAHVLLNISRNTFNSYYFREEALYPNTNDNSVDEFFARVASNIASEEIRDEFQQKFSLQLLQKDIITGTLTKELKIPYLLKNKGVHWYLFSTSITRNPQTHNIEAFASLTDIDNEVRLGIAVNHILNSEYETLLQIDVQSGIVTVLGANTNGDMSEKNKNGLLYSNCYRQALEENILPEYLEEALNVLNLERVIEKLNLNKDYVCTFPGIKRDDDSNRVCQWRFEYSDETHNTIMMTRLNIARFLNDGYDSLTGMLDRNGFYQRAQQELEAHPDKRYYLIEVDFDGFKLINEKYGYSGGNRFLRRFSADVRKNINRFGSGEIIGHLESDIFVLLRLADETSPEKIYEDLSVQINAYPEAYRLTLRMGVYEVDNPNYDIALLCEFAHLARKSCKGHYHEKIKYYTPELKDKMLDEQVLATEMKNALDNEQFEIWFQPQVNHSNKDALIGAEALVRWKHPTRGMISPAVFIPLFEQNGFIYELDKYVWEYSCQHLRNLLDECSTTLPISVNISRIDISHKDFLDTIVSIANKYSIPYNMLHLEITESAFSESTGAVVEIVRELIDRGFTVAIDDFGSGYSSLSLLRKVPAQILKLDMRFFEDDEYDLRNECILESIVRMANMLGMSVLAEGVERIDQADFLREVGCSYIQGYLYAKPMPFMEYKKLFLKNY